jgi:hypothetical protein
MNIYTEEDKVTQVEKNCEKKQKKGICEHFFQEKKMKTVNIK